MAVVTPNYIPKPVMVAWGVWDNVNNGHPTPHAGNSGDIDVFRTAEGAYVATWAAELSDKLAELTTFWVDSAAYNDGDNTVINTGVTTASCILTSRDFNATGQAVQDSGMTIVVWGIE